jgi:hypothetical protein
LKRFCVRSTTRAPKGTRLGVRAVVARRNRDRR